MSSTSIGRGDYVLLPIALIGDVKQYQSRKGPGSVGGKLMTDSQLSRY